jgi:hypothetical protein
LIVFVGIVMLIEKPKITIAGLGNS